MESSDGQISQIVSTITLKNGTRKIVTEAEHLNGRKQTMTTILPMDDPLVQKTDVIGPPALSFSEIWEREEEEINYHGDPAHQFENIEFNPEGPVSDETNHQAIVEPDKDDSNSGWSRRKRVILTSLLIVAMGIISALVIIFVSLQRRSNTTSLSLQSPTISPHSFSPTTTISLLRPASSSTPALAPLPADVTVQAPISGMPSMVVRLSTFPTNSPTVNRLSGIPSPTPLPSSSQPTQSLTSDVTTNPTERQTPTLQPSDAGTMFPSASELSQDPTLLPTLLPTIQQGSQIPSFKTTSFPTTAPQTSFPTANTFFPSCSVCGEGSHVTKHDSLSYIPDEGLPIPCSIIQLAGFQGLIPTYLCPTLPSLIGESCGCSEPSGNGTCTDAIGWVDKDNDSCEFYEAFGCDGSDTFVNSVGVSAAEACCSCGGGNDNFVDEQTPGECRDYFGFVDSFGDGCALYEEEDACGPPSITLTNAMGASAQEACCVCGGGSQAMGDF